MLCYAHLASLLSAALLLARCVRDYMNQISHMFVCNVPLFLHAAAPPPVPAERSRRSRFPAVGDHGVPEELLLSLTSTFCSRGPAGATAHHRHCKVASSSHAYPHPAAFFSSVRLCFFFLFSKPCAGLGSAAARRSVASPSQTQEIPVLFGEPDRVTRSGQVRVGERSKAFQSEY